MAQAIEEPETFEIDGVEYKTNPTMVEFLKESGAAKKDAQISKMKNVLKAAGIEEPNQMFGMFLPELAKIENLSEAKANILYEHASRVMRRGNLLMDVDKIREREANFKYLPTGSSELDSMLQYTDGSIGYRSKTMIELYGGAGSGKTQICYTAACMIMRPVEVGGWGMGVAYIDSEGAFEYKRFERLARYWGVDISTIENKFLYARVGTFDDVEIALKNIGKQIKNKNIGIIIIDSIMDPLKAQYPVGGQELSNLQPRQKHLKRVLDKLKNLAEINNLVTIYTNHIRSNIGGYGADFDAQGGAVIAHASDIRVLLDKPTAAEKKERVSNGKLQEGLKMGRAKVVDSGFIGNNVGYYLIGPMGIADTLSYESVAMHAKMIKEKGYMCIDSHGNVLEPLADDNTNREDKVGKFRSWLYGKPKTEIPKKTAKNKNKTKKKTA